MISEKTGITRETAEETVGQLLRKLWHLNLLELDERAAVNRVTLALKSVPIKGAARA